MRRSNLLLLTGLILQTVASSATAQPSDYQVADVAPRFVSTKEPVSATGVKSCCDLPASMHMRNSGGNDRTKDNPRGLPGHGYGLCVFTSIEIMSRWLNVMEVAGFQKWMENKPGGGFPAKVDQMIAAFCKEKGIAVPEYVQHTGGDDAFLDLAVSTGRGACVTYAGFDGFYKDQWGRDCWIDHMVYLAHLDQDWAAIIDNNRPGSWVWMSRKEFLTRWRARGGGWAFVFLASPPPPHLLSQMLLAQGGCVGVCGDACACGPGKCPAQCPVLFGQNCPNGRCPVPLNVPPLPDLSAPIYQPLSPSVGGQWLANTNGREWGFWVNGRCVAAAFADGRVEGTTVYGAANGQPIEPPAPLPAGVRQTTPPSAEPPTSVGENYGLMRDKIHQRTSYSITGRESTEETVHERLLNNDGDRWHLTAVGDAAFLTRFKGDVGALPAATRAKLHTQAYTSDSWTIKLFSLPAGVSLRKPATARRSEQLGTLAVADYSAAKLAELLNLMNGPRPSPAKPDDKPLTPAGPRPEFPWLALAIVGGLAVWILARGR